MPNHKVCCVVPIYNVRAFLADCLDSLASQTLSPEDFQVILVDDGSTDGSSEIADEYAAKYPNFEVHHIENQGLGHARNYGVQYADAEFICFADSDDIIMPFAYEEMYNLGIKNDTDMVLGDVCRFNSKKEYKSSLHRKAFRDAEEVMHITTHPNLINDTTSWNKLFRSTFYFANNLFWPEGIVYEDIPVTIPAHYLANSVSYLNKIVYKWRARDLSAPSLTQQRTDSKNFFDRMRVMDMVDEFFDCHHLDEEQRLNKDIHWLNVDYLIFINGCRNADEEYQRRVVGVIKDRLERINPKAYESLYSIDRIKYRAVLLGDIAKLADALTFQKRGMKTLRAEYDKRDNRWYGNYPFNWANHSDCDMTYEMHQFGLRQHIRSVQLDKNSGLVIEGTAFAPRVSEYSSKRILASTSLRAIGGAPVEEVPINPMRAPKPLRIDLSRDYRRIVLRGRAHRWYQCNVPMELLSKIPAGEYKIDLAYTCKQLTCIPRAICSPKAGSKTRPSAICDGVWEYSIGYDPNYELVLYKNPVSNLVTAIDNDADEAVSLIVDGKSNHFDCLNLGYGDKVETEYSYYGAPTIVDLEESCLSFSASSSGHMVVEKLFRGVRLAAASIDCDNTFSCHIEFEPTVEPRLVQPEFVGRRYGVSVPLNVTSLISADGVCRAADACLNISDEEAVSTMRADSYELKLRMITKDGHESLLPAYSSSRSELRGVGSPFEFNRYRYTLNQNGVKAQLDVAYCAPWYEKTKRSLRLVNLIAYPLFRLLPIKKHSAIFESYWATKNDCNPYALYEWIDSNHPEWSCVVPVRDLRVQVNGKAKKVLYQSLRYNYEIARAKILVNNVNFPYWYRKRSHQVEIQTMHGTPLKTLGLDVKSDFPTQESIDQFIEKCNRWDYLVVQGKACEDITKRCYLFNRKFLETGYPRNDELFARNTNEEIRQLKISLGLDPNKKFVLYAPTWRIKNRFDLKLDMTEMCNRLGEEYQFGLRVHHLAQAGFDSSKLDPRIIDLTNAPSITELYLVSDVLITDYSSVMFDYAVLPGRQMLFFPYDLDVYRDELRGFNIDLETEAPGPLLYSTEEIISAIENLEATKLNNRDLYDRFVKKYIEFEQGTASEQIYNAVFDS